MAAVVITMLLVVLFIIGFSQLGSTPEGAIVGMFIVVGILAYITYYIVNAIAIYFSSGRDGSDRKNIFDYIRKKRETDHSYFNSTGGNYENRTDRFNDMYHDKMKSLNDIYSSPGSDPYVATSITEQAWGRGVKNKSQLVAVGKNAVRDHYIQVEAKKENPKPDMVEELPADYYDDYKRPPSDIFK